MTGDILNSPSSIVEEILSFYKSLMGSVASILPAVNMVTMREHHQQVELCTKVTHGEISEVGSCFANCKKKTPNLTRDGNEIELEFELIGNEMMWELERFVGYHKKAMSKMRRQSVTEDVVIVQLNKAPTLEPAMPKNKKVDVVEEDVDISEEIPEAAALALGVLALSMDGDVGVLGPLTLNPERLGTDDFEGTDEELLFRLFWDEEVWNWSDSRGMKNAFGCGNRWW
ncbi:hypothetical protein BC332_28464 [Capsicum chinense]|nr:hypothetical protein BC332_28464 [Capsicum chinense]